MKLKKLIKKPKKPASNTEVDISTIIANVNRVFDKPSLTAERIQANKDLADLLFKLIKRYPSLRFSQILLNFGFTARNRDDFYTEPKALLEIVMKEYKRMHPKG